MGDNVYKITDLQGNERDVHAVRLFHYDGKNFVPLPGIKKYFDTVAKIIEVEKMRILRFTKARGFEFQIE